MQTHKHPAKGGARLLLPDWFLGGVFHSVVHGQFTSGRSDANDSRFVALAVQPMPLHQFMERANLPEVGDMALDIGLRHLRARGSALRS